MEIQLCSKVLYRVTMDIEVEPNKIVDKEKYLNKLDEAYKFLCLSISRDLIFHIKGLNTPKEFWDKLSSLFEKQDDMRIYQLKNELISLHPSNFKTLNDFFTKFKHLVFQLKLCKVEKEDDKLILSILSKISADYLVFVSNFQSVRLTTPNWKMPTLDAFIESLTHEHDKLIQMGIIQLSRDQALVVGGPKGENDKGKQRDKSLVKKEQSNETSGSKRS